MPIDIIIYALITLFLVFRLWDSLGTRHGSERSRPNPYAAETEAGAKADSDAQGEKGDADNIIHVGGVSEAKAENFTGDRAIDTALVQIALTDRDFTPDDFQEKAKDAFVYIVEAYAEGDRDTLRGLMADALYGAFDTAISEREAAGETLMNEIHAVRKSDIIAAKLEDGMAYVTVRFVADETIVTRDKDGAVISGNPNRVDEVTDVWTFLRDVKSKDPRWLLVETREEDSAKDKDMPGQKT